MTLANLITIWKFFNVSKYVPSIIPVLFSKTTKSHSKFQCMINASIISISQYIPVSVATLQAFIDGIVAKNNFLRYYEINNNTGQTSSR